MLFSCSARVSWGTFRAAAPAPQDEELLFWGDQYGGAITRRAPIGEAETPRSAGRGNRPEAVPKTEGREPGTQTPDGLHRFGTGRRRVRTNCWIAKRIGAADQTRDIERRRIGIAVGRQANVFRRLF